MCQWLRVVKVPTGFSSNIKSLVSMKDHALTSFNAHYCHIMLMVFLPIAIRAIGPEYVKMVITRLSYYFNWITQKVIDEAELPGMKQFIAEMICQLEMCFPPSYFDIMPHLMMHMVDQIQDLGPIYLHQMNKFASFLQQKPGKVGFLTTVDGIPVVGQPALVAARDHGDVPRYLAATCITAGSGVRCFIHSQDKSEQQYSYFK